MVFTRRLREGVRRGRIRCSIRIWTRAHVKVGGRYPMDDGHIIVDSITQMDVANVTADLARESGFESVDDLLQIAKHGSGDNVYLIRFHYMPPGAVEYTKVETEPEDRLVMKNSDVDHDAAAVTEGGHSRSDVGPAE